MGCCGNTSSGSGSNQPSSSKKSAVKKSKGAIVTVCVSVEYGETTVIGTSTGTIYTVRPGDSLNMWSPDVKSAVSLGLFSVCDDAYQEVNA